MYNFKTIGFEPITPLLYNKVTFTISLHLDILGVDVPVAFYMSGSC